MVVTSNTPDPEQRQHVPGTSPATNDQAPNITSAEELTTTLRAFVRRVAMILQAEKCVIMLYEQETGDLAAQLPALRFTDEEVAAMRVRAGEGLTGDVFRESRAVICQDCAADPRCQAEDWARFGVTDSLSVPMVIERRNASQQVVEMLPIGVVHVFNKRHGLKFTEEDVHLLTVLSRNAAAVITTAKVFLHIADEKKQLESTLRSMPSGLLVVSRAGQIQIINDTAGRLLEMKPGDGAGTDFREGIANEEIRGFLTEALAADSSQAQEFQIRERFYQAQADLVRDERDAVTGVLCVFNDVTELRNVERMKTDFVTTVSHELRTPLTSIKGFVRTLLEDPEGEYYDQATRLEFYNIIDSECDRLIRLISDLLNVSRIERGLPLHMNYAQVDVATLVEQCLAFHRGYTTHHELVTEIEPDLAPIEADRDKLDQVLSNLISNAIKYSPDGGTITVRVSDGGSELKFAVSDQGLGIPPEHIEKVFQRFHRVHSGDSQRVGGTGIGLFLTKSLVDAHGGTIHAESTIGSGSTFHFTIPQAPPVGNN
ncbi:MAG: ATP-binding protein [Armatimonadota bacterium]